MYLRHSTLTFSVTTLGRRWLFYFKALSKEFTMTFMYKSDVYKVSERKFCLNIHLNRKILVEFLYDVTEVRKLLFMFVQTSFEFFIDILIQFLIRKNLLLLCLFILLGFFSPRKPSALSIIQYLWDGYQAVLKPLPLKASSFNRWAKYLLLRDFVK